MFEAAAVGNTQRVKEILQETPEVLNHHSEDGWTALALASFFGHKETAAYLLEQGADLSLRSKNSMDNQPLHAAIAGGRSEVAQLLVEHGADIHNIAGGGWTSLHLAAANGDVATVDMLLARGAKLELKNDEGNTPLALAVKFNREAVVERLKEEGVQE